MSGSHRQNAFGDKIFDKTIPALSQLGYNKTELQWAAKQMNSYNIMLCGSPRVGKSSLINALCGKKVATTSASLASCTKTVERHRLEGVYKSDTQQFGYTVDFWDTPGLESWTEADVHSYVDSIVQKTRPICMIYCASPGSFANLTHLKWLVDRCIQNEILCALVCTNMWQNNRRKVVMEEFKNLLRHHGEERQSSDGITYFGNVKGLCAMVNSEVYQDYELKIEKPPEGVNELIFGIMSSLEDEKFEAWALAVLNNRSFWRKCGHKIVGYFQEDPKGIRLKQNARDIGSFLMSIMHAFK
jgi:small GTP-binding protein